MCWNFAYADGEAEEAIRDETGTLETQCSVCGETLKDGELLSHWKSGSCMRISMKRHRQQTSERIAKSIAKYS